MRRDDLLCRAAWLCLCALLGCNGEASLLSQGTPPPAVTPPGEMPIVPGVTPPVETPPKPVETCGEPGSLPVPTAFSTNCGGCHRTSGAATNGVPDLRAYTGDLARFTEVVRKGGARMPPFGEELVSATAIESIYTYFKAPAPTQVTCPGTVTPTTCSGVGQPIGALFPEAASVQPITTKLPSGALLLNGAGRVRGRHENEAEFSLFHPSYFEHRSYRFTVEDSLPAGGKTVKFTWDSAGKTAAAPLTNFRYWYTHSGNVFHANVDMVRITDTRYEFTVTRNDRENRDIRLGDLLEFEFGVFLDPNAVQGRTNYYTDTFRYVVGSGKLTPFDKADDEALSGADLTITPVVAEPQLSFEQMALNIQPSGVQKFLEGRRLFHTDFATGEHTEPNNPVLTAQARKAGPLLNQASCAGCHFHNGRGAPPEPGQRLSSAVVKTFASGTSPAPHPDYGRQLQDKAQGSVPAEGSATVTYVEQPGQFPDGTPYTLRKPTYQFSGLSGGALTNASIRVARPLVGMGLLEAVPEDVLMQRADEKDCDGDGISGRVNLVAEPLSGALRFGRFGWKASKVSVAHQVADALVNDMGVTTRAFPTEECGANQAACKAAMSAQPELADEEMDRLTTYMRLLGVPGRRLRADAAVARGEKLFAQVGCVSCHAATLITGAKHPLVELRGQVLHPYSDLLLHDLGDGLADPAPTQDGLAAASEWRTPPLWGLGLTKTVSGHTQLLHDGRARNTTEAVLWHGGEAGAARARFVALSKDDRTALLAFLDSL